MPAHLNRDARKEWRRLVPILLAMGVLSDGDGIALANLCQAYSVLIAAQRLMRKTSKDAVSGLLMKTPSGYVQISPLLSICNRQIEIVNGLLREFGLTPSSRTRIETVPGRTPGGFDPLERRCVVEEAAVVKPNGRFSADILYPAFCNSRHKGYEKTYDANSAASNRLKTMARLGGNCRDNREYLNNGHEPSSER